MNPRKHLSRHILFLVLVIVSGLLAMGAIYNFMRTLAEPGVLLAVLVTIPGAFIGAGLALSLFIMMIVMYRRYRREAKGVTQNLRGKALPNTKAKGIWVTSTLFAVIVLIGAGVTFNQHSSGIGCDIQLAKMTTLSKQLQQELGSMRLSADQNLPATARDVGSCGYSSLAAQEAGASMMLSGIDLKQARAATNSELTERGYQREEGQNVTPAGDDRPHVLRSVASDRKAASSVIDSYVTQTRQLQIEYYLAEPVFCGDECTVSNPAVANAPVEKLYVTLSPLRGLYKN